MVIAVVDYGMGNLKSVYNAFKRMGTDVVLTSSRDEIAGADAIVLPGVGAFGDAMKNLSTLGLDDELKKAISDGKPFLGICLGLQLLFEKSYENGVYDGLGVFKGKVVRFPDSVRRVPHIGWNQVWWKKSSQMWENVKSGSFFYFVHSFIVLPDDESLISSITDYGIDFVSSVWRDNVFAVQFHPEKSHRTGEKLLRSWLKFYGLSR